MSRRASVVARPLPVQPLVLRRVLFATATLAALLAITGRVARAQEEEGTRVTLRVGPTALDFAGFGGRFGAAVAELSVARRFGANAGADLSAFTILPTGGATATPGCTDPVSGACVARSSPNALNGVLLSPFTFVGGSNLRIATGVGVIGAAGGEGFPRRSSAAFAAGIDWVPDSRSRLAPSVGIRAVRLANPVAGVRQLLMPGVGVTF